VQWELPEGVAHRDQGHAPVSPSIPARFRPHQGLGGATPAEMYFGTTPAHLSAIPPPRGRAGEGPMDLPFRVDYLDAERLLPLLVRKAA